MNLTLVEKIAEAVLYEGYILYPYRASAVKNRQRWNFGALCPQSYSVVQKGTEAWVMQTECLIDSRHGAALEVKVRFLQLMSREVRDAGGQLLPSLQINGQLFVTWEEAVEREVCVPLINLRQAVSAHLPFKFPASRQVELLRDESSGDLVGQIVRKKEAIEGLVEITATKLDDELIRLNVNVKNLTELDHAEEKSRDEALMRSFVSTHTILGLLEGQFVSLLDPPAPWRLEAAKCTNVGTYPVLAGEEGSLDCMLSSPIILYDYPQIAPESAGALFDGTEIDEILTLRIMTLTDEEKREMAGSDERARQILERTETLPQEHLLKMHGVMRSVNRKT
jgi:hydrogenase maturation protease